MNVMWHITRRKNYESILLKGLIPGFRAGITTSWGRKDRDIKNYVFLTDNPRYILDRHCGPEWCTRHTPLVLEVNVENLPHVFRGVSEYTVDHAIEASRITGLRDLKTI